MKIFSYILSFIFILFLFTPTVVSLIDRDVDISIAYNVNEEESSSKNQITFEYTIEEMDSNYRNVHFLKTGGVSGHCYKENGYNVFLSTSSPPPKQA